MHQHKDAMSMGIRKFAILLVGAIISVVTLFALSNTATVRAAGEAPVLMSVSPTSVSSVGGDTVTLTGAYFDEGASVFFGTTEAVSVTFVNDATLTATVPAGSAGIVDVTVENGDGQKSVFERGLTYRYAAPVVTSVSPVTTSTLGGAAIKLQGSGFFHTLRFRQVVGGEFHTCGLTNDYKVYCWGYNLNGQLGNGATTTSAALVDITASGALAGKTIVTLAAGDAHTLALDSDGKVYAWGNNTSGRLGNGGSSGNSTVPVEVTASGALAGKTIVAIDAGTDHSLALDSDGKVYAWGANGSGQLGIGSNDVKTVPTAVDTSGVLQDEHIVAISAGQGFSLVASETGRVFSWGGNPYGQLGDGTVVYRTAPVAVDDSGALAGKKIVRVAAGWYHSVALDDTGVVYAWGSNNYGQVGTGNKTQANTPAAVVTSGALNGKTLVTVDAGRAHTIASDRDGVAYAWGWGSDGQNGVNSTADLLSPTAMNTTGVLSGKHISSVVVGSTYSLLLDSLGRLYAAGDNTYGQLGTGATSADARLAVAGVEKMPARHTITVDGIEATIQDKTDDQLLFIAPAHSIGKVPVVVSEPSTDTLVISDAYEYIAPPSITSISPTAAYNTAGDTVTITGSGFLDDAKVTIGGVALTNVVRINDTTITATLPVNDVIGSANVIITNTDKQSATLYGGFTLKKTAPTITSVSPGKGPIAGGASVTLEGTGLTQALRFVDISAGNTHACGVTGTGAVYCWGQNGSGQLGNNSTVDSSLPAAVSTGGVLAGKRIVDVEVGNNHTLALDATGKVYAWGAGGNGQLGVNSTASSTVPVEVMTSGVLSGKTIVAVSAGTAYSVALDSDGKVYGWGQNANGQLGDSSASQRLSPVATTMTGVLAGKKIKAISAAGNSTLALDTDGKAYGWGANAGQLGDGSATGRTAPVAVLTSGVLAGKTLTSVVSGGTVSYAIDADGKIYSWGVGTQGQLGNATNNTVTSPVEVTMTGVLSGKRMVAASAKGTHVLALDDTGKVYAWGAGGNGALGNGSNANSNIPVEVTSTGVLQDRVISQVAAGANYLSVALDTTGRVYSWGLGTSGQLGNGAVSSSATPVATTVAIPIAFTVTFDSANAAVTSRTQNSLIVTTPAHASGVVSIEATAPYVDDVTLGDAYEYLDPPQVSAVSPNSGVRYGGDTVVISGSHFSEGVVVRFGEDEATIVDQTETSLTVTTPPHKTGAFAVTVTDVAGQSYVVEDGFTYTEGALSVFSISPTRGPASGGQTITVQGENLKGAASLSSITKGSSSTCGIVEGRAYCWGYNNRGQLGDGTTTNSSSPVAVDTSGVLSGKTMTAISAGDSHTIAIDSDGKVYTWGYNSYGQLGNGSTVDSSVPVEVSMSGVLSGKTITAVAAGDGFTLALDATGKVYAWGANDRGQLGNNSTTTSSVPVAVITTGVLSGKTITKIAAGGGQALALDTAGVVYRWGGQTTTQTTTVTTTSPTTTPVSMSASGLLAGKTVVDITAGLYHALVLTSDNLLYSWGGNAYGSLGNNATSTSTTPVAVTMNGALNGKTIKSISGGGRHSVVSTTDGYVYAWGLNTSGQVGDSSVSQRNTPVAVTTTGALNGKYIESVHAGGDTTLALSSELDVYAWGGNAQGQFGSGNTVSSTSPVRTIIDVTVTPTVEIGGVRVGTKAVNDDDISFVVPAGSAGFVDVTVIGYDGQSDTISDGYEYISGPVISSVVPSSGVKFGGDTVTITGTYFSTGSVVTFGGVEAEIINQTSTTMTVVSPAGSIGAVDVKIEDSFGQTITAAAAFNYVEPAPVVFSVAPTRGPVSGGQPLTITGENFVAGEAKFTQIAAGAYHNLAVTDKGEVYAWGRNLNGQLGNGATANNEAVTAVSTTGVLAGKTIVAVAAGETHSLALDSDGKVYAWGLNANGQLGDNSTTQRTTPVAVNTAGVLAGKKIEAIAAGNGYSVALDSDGKVYAWGLNTNGQLGDNSTTQRIVPVAVLSTGVLNGKTITKIAAGSSHVLALDNSGKVYAWGWGIHGQLGNNAASNSAVPVDVNVSGVLAGKTMTAIAAGNTHSLAVDSDGKVYAWGGNANGQLGDNSVSQRNVPVLVTATDALAGKEIVSVASGASASHSLAVDSDGKVYAWGANANGQLGDNSATQRIMPVAISESGALVGKRVAIVSVGAAHSVALDSDGKGYGWGNNASAQIKSPVSGSAIATATSLTHPRSVMPNVTFNDTDLVDVQLLSDTTISAKAPAHTAGHVNLTVTSYDNQSHTLSSAYEYVAGPTVASVIANSGSIAGGNTVYVNGTGFSESSVVTIGGAEALVTYVNSTTLLVTVPASVAPGDVDVVVTDVFGQKGTLENGYTYQLPSPTVTSVSPQYGKMSGGDTLTLTGSNFVTKAGGGSWYTLLVDGTAAEDVTVVNSTTITATLPAHEPGVVDVSLGGEYSETAVLASALTYLPESYAFINEPQTVMAVEPAELIVEARDENGEPITSTEDIVLHLSSDANTGAFARALTGPSAGWDYDTVIIPAGQSSVTFFYRDSQKGTPTITVSDALDTKATEEVTVLSRYKLLITGITSPTSVGVPSSVTVQAVDYTGIAQTDYRGTVRFTTNDGAASIPAEYTFTAADYGRRTFTNGVTFGTQGVWSVTATDAEDDAITGTQSGVIVGPPPAGEVAQFNFITSPQSFPLDSTSSVMTVQLQDNSGFPVVANNTVNLYVRSTSSTGEISVDGGATWLDVPAAVSISQNHTSLNFMYRDTVAGSYTVKASQFADNDFGWKPAEQEVVVGVGAPASIKIDAPVSSPAGVWTPVQVGMQDSSGNSVSAANDMTIVLTVSENAEYSLFATGENPQSALEVVVPAGQRSITVYVRATSGEEMTLTGTDARPLGDDETAYPSGSATILLGSADPAGLVIASPSTARVHDATTVSVSLKDQFGNIVVAEEPTDIVLSTNSGDGTFAETSNGPWSSTITMTVSTGSSGGSVSFKHTTVKSDVSITAAADNLDGASETIDITAGVYANKIRIDPSSPTTIAAGVEQVYTIQPVDAWGNPTTHTEPIEVGLGGAQPETATWNGVAVTSPTTPDDAATKLTIGAGESGVSAVYRNTLLGTTTISAWQTASWQQYCANETQNSCLEYAYSNNTLVSKEIIVEAGAPVAYQITTEPQVIVKNTASRPIMVRLIDEFENETSFKGEASAVVDLATTSATGSFSLDVDNWLQIASLTYEPGVSRQTIYYRDTVASGAEGDTLTVSGNLPGDEQAIRVVDGFASKVVLDLAGRTTTVAGDYLPVTLRTATDDDLEVVVLKDVTFTLSPDETGGFYEYNEVDDSYTEISEVTIPAERSNVELFYRATLMGDKTLRAESASLDDAEVTLTVLPNAVQKLVYTTVPDPARVEVTRASDAFIATAHDVFGNVVVMSDTEANTLALASSHSSGEFSLDPIGGWGAESVPVLAGATSSQPFYYKNGFVDSVTGALDDPTVLGLQTIRAELAGADPAEAEIDVVGLLATKIVYLSEPQTVVAGERSQKITVQLQLTENGVDRPAVTTYDRSFSIRSLDTTGTELFAGTYGDDVFTDKDGNEITSVTVEAGTSKASFYVTPKTAGAHRIIVDGSILSHTNTTLRYVSAHQPITVTHATPAKLDVRSAEQVIYPAWESKPNEVSSPIKVVLTDEFGNPATEATNRTISVATTCVTGRFLTGPNGEETDFITLTAGQSDTYAYYQDTQAHANPCTLRFSSFGLDNGLQDISVRERVHHFEITSEPQVIEAGQTSEPIHVETRDRFGNTVTVEEAQTLVFSASGQNNTLTPVSVVIPAGGSATTFTFSHDLAVNGREDYEVTVADPAGHIAEATQSIGVVSGAPARLGWEKEETSTTVGEFAPVRVMLLNAYGKLTTATENTTVNLSHNAGTNTELNESAGSFYVKNGDDVYTKVSSVTIAEGTKQTGLYYRQTTTTKSRSLVSSIGGMIESRYGKWQESDAPKTIYAAGSGLATGSASVSVNPYRLSFSTGNFSAQARAFTPMRVTISGPLPEDVTVNLSTSAASNDAGFYSANTAETDDAIEAARLTTVTIPAGSTESEQFYYRQTSGQQVSNPVPTQLNAEPVGAAWSTWSGQAYASIYIGAVTEIVITNGPSSLEQGQKGTYTFETRDSLGNAAAMVPYRPNERVQGAPVCLYIRTDSETPTIGGAPSQTCSDPPAQNIAVVTMSAGATQGTFTYSDTLTGERTLTVANSSAGVPTLKGEKKVTITDAVTQRVGFEKQQYAMIQGSVLDTVTVQLKNAHGYLVNSVGDVEMLVESSSATGMFKNIATGDWEEHLWVTIPAGQTSITLSYRDDSAPLGTSTLYVTADSLQAGSAQLTLATGDFAGVRFVDGPQTLQRQQSGTFTLVTTDPYGGETPPLVDLCFYVTSTSQTATISGVTQEGCTDITLPGGGVARAVFVPGGVSRVSFTMSDRTAGVYDLRASTQPGGGGVAVTQEVTIINGEPTEAAFEDNPYLLERGGVVSPRLVLKNAYGAQVPAVRDMYFKLSADSPTGQFAESVEGTWSSTLQVVIPAGESEIHVLYKDIDPIIGEYRLTAEEVTSEGVELEEGEGVADTEATVSIIYGAAVQLDFSTPERTTIATHPSDVMTVTLQNKFGVETIAETDLPLYVRSNSPGGAFSNVAEGQWGITTVKIPAGETSVDVFYRDKTVGTHSISVRNMLTQPENSDVLYLEATQDHTIVRQVFDHFVVTNIATPQKAGLPSSVVVFAVDKQGYVVEWYDGTIRFNSDSNDALYPDESYTFNPDIDKGIHTFVNSIAFASPGIKSVTVTDENGRSGTQYDIVVTAGNEAPVRELAIITPEVQPTSARKDEPTERIIVQLRDEAGAATNTTISSGYPVRLTSDSPTGQFAVSPDGPWVSSITTVVPAGFSFTTTPLYYRDSASGTHSIQASDWIDAVDSTLIKNGSLTVIVPELLVNSSVKTFSMDYSGAYIENPYLFARTQQGEITGYATIDAEVRDAVTGDVVAANWQTTVTQGSEVVNTQSVSNQTALRYRTPDLTPQVGSDQYVITAKATSQYADGVVVEGVQVSPWRAVLSQVDYTQAGVVGALLTVTNAGEAADSLQATISLPAAARAWTLQGLLDEGYATRVNTGTYQIGLPIGQLKSGEYVLAVSLADGIGITAQDSVAFIVAPADEDVKPGQNIIPAIPTVPEVEVPAGEGDDTDAPSSGGGFVKPTSPSSPSTPQTAGDNSFVARVLRSPATPVAVSGILFGVVALIAVLLMYQAYKEWRRARWLIAIVKKNQQTVADKNSFLELAAHHLRTPMTLIKTGVEMLAMNPQATQLAQNLKVSAEQLHYKIEQIVEETHNAPELSEVTAVDTATMRAKILRSPLFWLPLIASVTLTILSNWAIATFGGQVVGTTMVANQVIVIILGAVLLYTAARQLAMRRERRAQLDASRHKVEALNKAKIAFAERVQAGLSDDILRIGGFAQEVNLIDKGPVGSALAEGAERLKQLVSRFAVLSSIYTINPTPQTFAVEYAVDDALKEVAREKDISQLTINDHTQHLAISQDRRLMTKLFETVITSMAPVGQAATLTVDGKQEKDGTTTLRISGSSIGEAPAENLFSVYSRADQEAAGTMASPDETMQRLDLYLDRLIVDSLGGDIDAKKSGGRMSVLLKLPALR